MSEVIRAQLEHVNAATYEDMCVQLALVAYDQRRAALQCMREMMQRLHEAQKTIDRRDEELAELRDERRRLAITLFGEPQ